MSCKNKCCWWPHNWLCLRGLYWTFVALFYFAIAYTIYIAYLMVRSPMLIGQDFWIALVSMLFNALGVLLGLLTITVILKSLRKIVHAVAPCCCHEQAEGKEEVAVTTTKEEK